MGKTSHCESLAQNTGLRHLSINQVIKERGCHEGWDDELKSWIVDEDRVRQPPSSLEIRRALCPKLTVCVPRKLLDSIEDEVKRGGNIIDWHACDLFPESWIDLVVVLRTDTAALYDRLASRFG